MEGETVIREGKMKRKKKRKTNWMRIQAEFLLLGESSNRRRRTH
jgi:hypothetical protein